MAIVIVVLFGGRVVPGRGLIYEFLHIDSEVLEANGTTVLVAVISLGVGLIATGYFLGRKKLQKN